MGGEEDGEDEEDKQHVNCSQYDVPHVSLASTSLYFYPKLYSVWGKQQAEKLRNCEMKVEGWRGFCFLMDWQIDYIGDCRVAFMTEKFSIHES